MGKAQELPKGYVCERCGHREPFKMYVYARWYDELESHCPNCSQVIRVCRGVVLEGGTEFYDVEEEGENGG